MPAGSKSPKTPKSGRTGKRPTTARSSGGKKKKAGARSKSPENVSMRMRAVTSDDIAVSNRFEGNYPRAVAAGLRGTAWTAEADGSIIVRAAPGGYEIGRVEPYGTSTVSCLLKVSENKMWVGYSDGALRVMHTDTLKVLFESTEHSATVMAMSTVNNLVFVGGNDWKIYVYDKSDYHFERMLFGHSNSVRCLAGFVDPETGANRLASGGDDGIVKIWDPSRQSDSACLAELDGHDGSVLSAAVLPDTSELWTGGEDGTVQVWDLFSMGPMASIVAQTSPVATIQVVGDLVWTGGKDGRITVFDRFTKALVHEASQPPSGTGSHRGAMLIQPVQSTVLHNVWASNANGDWQNWSCRTQEREAPPSAGKGLISSRAAAASRGRDAGEGAGEEATSMTPEEQAAAERYKALRRSVADIRRSVVALPEDDGEEDDEEGGDYAADDADSVTLERVEKSIRRDREADGEERRQRSLSQPQSNNASAARGGYSPAPTAPGGASDSAAAAAAAEQQRRDQERIAELEKELEAMRRANAVNTEELGSMTNDLQTQRDINRQLQEQLEAAAAAAATAADNYGEPEFDRAAPEEHPQDETAPAVSAAAEPAQQQQEEESEEEL